MLFPQAVFNSTFQATLPSPTATASPVSLPFNDVIAEHTIIPVVIIFGVITILSLLFFVSCLAVRRSRRRAWERRSRMRDLASFTKDWDAYFAEFGSRRRENVTFKFTWFLKLQSWVQKKETDESVVDWETCSAEAPMIHCKTPWRELPGEDWLCSEGPLCPVCDHDAGVLCENHPYARTPWIPRFSELSLGQDDKSCQEKLRDTVVEEQRREPVELGTASDISSPELLIAGKPFDLSESEFSSTLESDGSVTTPSGSIVVPLSMEVSKRRMVETLMAECRALVNMGWRSGLSIKAGAGTASGSCPDSSGSQSRSAKRRHEEDANVESSKRMPTSTSESNGSKKTKRSGTTDVTVARRLACPFYKRNSQKHLKHRSCGGPGWESAHRVKEHLYRNHKMPIHCNRCGEIMRSPPDLVMHQRQTVACEVRLVNLPEGLDDAKETALRKRSRGATEQDKWVEIYNILFPDEEGDLIPSPYYDSEATQEDAVMQYERVQRRELLRLVRKRLEEEAGAIAGPMEDNLRDQFVNIIREVQQEVFRLCRGRMPVNGQDSQGSTSLCSPEQQGPGPLHQPASPTLTTLHDPVPDQNFSDGVPNRPLGFTPPPSRLDTWLTESEISNRLDVPLTMSAELDLNGWNGILGISDDAYPGGYQSVDYMSWPSRD